MLSQFVSAPLQVNHTFYYNPIHQLSTKITKVILNYLQVTTLQQVTACLSTSL